MDFLSSVTTLQDFENDIKNSLRDLKKNTDEKVHSFRRQLICELAVVYKKLAMQYLGNGDTEMYMEYIQESQNRLSDCADLRKSADG